MYIVLWMTALQNNNNTMPTLCQTEPWHGTHRLRCAEFGHTFLWLARLGQMLALLPRSRDYSEQQQQTIIWWWAKPSQTANRPTLRSKIPVQVKLDDSHNTRQDGEGTQSSPVVFSGITPTNKVLGISLENCQQFWRDQFCVPEKVMGHFGSSVYIGQSKVKLGHFCQ